VIETGTYDTAEDGTLTTAVDGTVDGTFENETTTADG